VQAIGSTVAWAARNTVAQPVHRTAVQAVDSIVAQLAVDSIVAQLAADNTAADTDCTHRLVELVSGGDSIQQPEGC
jgi:hypothetical protein